MTARAPRPPTGWRRLGPSSPPMVSSTPSRSPPTPRFRASTRRSTPASSSRSTTSRRASRSGWPAGWWWRCEIRRRPRRPCVSSPRARPTPRSRCTPTPCSPRRPRSCPPGSTVEVAMPPMTAAPLKRRPLLRFRRGHGRSFEQRTLKASFRSPAGERCRAKPVGAHATSVGAPRADPAASAPLRGARRGGRRGGGGDVVGAAAVAIVRGRGGAPAADLWRR